MLPTKAKTKVNGQKVKRSKVKGQKVKRSKDQKVKRSKGQKSKRSKVRLKPRSQVRNVAVGGASTFARIGSMSAPYIVDILGVAIILSPRT